MLRASLLVMCLFMMLHFCFCASVTICVMLGRRH